MTTTMMMMQQTEGIETSHAKLTQIAWLMVVTITDPPYTRKMIASHTSISQHTVRNMQRVKAILLQQSPGRDLSTVSWQSVKHLAKWEVKVDDDGRVSLVPSKRWEKDRQFPRFKRRMD
jgi:hypothetical protein